MGTGRAEEGDIPWDQEKFTALAFAVGLDTSQAAKCLWMMQKVHRQKKIMPKAGSPRKNAQ